MDPVTFALNRPNDKPDFRIEESIWGIIHTAEGEPVTLSVWFKGDKRDGIDEVFFKCDKPNEDFQEDIFDLIWDKTGMTRHDFKDAKIIRIYDEKAEKELADVLPKLASEDLDDLQLILSLAQVMMENLDEQRSKPRSSAIDRWSSRASHAKVTQKLKATA